jgi:hypothetical protein
MAHGRSTPATLIGAWCTLPMMRWVPTPFAAVDESLEAETLRAPEAHDGHLRAAVHEHLQRMAVHLHVHVEHDDGSERLGRRLHGVLVVFVDVLESDRLLDLTLRLHVERVGVEQVDLSLARSLGPLARLVRLTKQRLHLRRVGVEDGGVEGRITGPKLLHEVRVRANLALERGGVHSGAVGGERHGVARARGGATKHHQQVAVLHPARTEDVRVPELAPVVHDSLGPGRDVRLSLDDGLEVLHHRVGVDVDGDDLVVLRGDGEEHRGTRRWSGTVRAARRGEARRGESRSQIWQVDIDFSSRHQRAFYHGRPARTLGPPRVPKRAPHKLQTDFPLDSQREAPTTPRGVARGVRRHPPRAPPLDALAVARRSRRRPTSRVVDRPGASPIGRDSTRTSSPRSSSPSVAPPSP